MRFQVVLEQSSANIQEAIEVKRSTLSHILKQARLNVKNFLELL